MIRDKQNEYKKTGYRQADTSNDQYMKLTSELD
jgi:hypothetical protein